MSCKHSHKRTHPRPKAVLRLPDLDQAKSAVLSSLTSTEGNWLRAEQSQRLWQAPSGQRLKEKRDRALRAVLLACGVRRHEAVNLNFGHIQQGEEHWAIVDRKRKVGQTRTIPMQRG